MKKVIDSKVKKKYITLVILICIYLITRLFFLFSINLFNEEECRVGTIAKELIIGPSLPIFDYPIFLGSNSPGRLLSGFLAIPFYLVFGESGISIKLMFLTVSVGIVCLVYLFLNKFFNSRAAIIAAMLMIFSIPVYTLSTMSQGGPHLESAFFDILIMFSFYKIFFDEKNDIKSFIFFGLACGFATFVNYTSLVMIFTCLLFWFIFDKKFFLRKYFFVFVVFFLVSFSPGIYYNLTHNFIGLFYRGVEPFISKILGNELSINRITQIITKFKDLIIYDLPKSFMFKDTLFFTSSFLSYIYYLLFICSFAFLLYYCRKSIKRLISGVVPIERFNIKSEKIRKETFILVYPLIFILIYCISSFSIDHDRFGADGYRYLLTFYVFMFIIISLFLTKLWNKKIKLIFIFLIIILFLFGLIGNFSFVFFSEFGKGIIYRPYCYDQLSIGYDGKQCKDLSYSYQSLCYAGYGTRIGYTMSDSNLESIKYCSQMDKSYRCFCYNGVGKFIHWNNIGNVTEFILQCNKLDENYRHCCYIGIGWIYGEIWGNNYPNLYHLCNEIDKKYKPYCFEGLGQGMAQSIGVIPTQAIRQCNKIEPKYRPYCFKGLAWSLAEKFGDNPTEAGKFGKYVSEDYSSYFYKGIGSYIGLMFSYNLTMAEEECDKLGGNNVYCINGLHEYINDVIYN